VGKKKIGDHEQQKVCSETKGNNEALFQQFKTPLQEKIEGKHCNYG
jgi:hypothetical protein